MKRLAIGLATLLIAATGVGSALAITRHTGHSVVDCKGVTFSFTEFANLNNNQVSWKVLVDNVVSAQDTFTFNGSSGTKRVDLNLAGDHLIQAQASWNTNGHQGSFDSGVVRQVCNTQTVTTSTTTPGTTSTVTTPTKTVTVTVQLPAPPAQTVTVTQPAVTLPAQTVTVSSPPTTVVKTVVKWRTKVVKKNCVCKSNYRFYRGACHPIARGKG